MFSAADLVKMKEALEKASKELASKLDKPLPLRVVYRIVKEEKMSTPIKENSEYPITIWPARVPTEIVKAKNSSGLPGGIGACYSPTEKTAYLPIVDNAYARTVRLHESLHAIYTPADAMKTDNSMSSQAVEDAILHLNYAATNGSVRRDELATAIKDLRRTVQTVVPRSSEAMDLAVLTTLRAAAIIQSQDNGKHSPVLDKLFKRALVSPCLKAAQEKGFEHIMPRVLDSVRKLDRAEAIKTLKTVMIDPDRTAPQSGGFMVLSGVKDVAAKERKTIQLDIASAPSEKTGKEDKVTSLSTDLLGNRTKKMLAKSSEKWPNMTVRKLHHVLPKKTREGRESKLVTSGINISGKNLAIAAVSPVPVPIFEKRKHERGGTILIDGSGSMSLDDKTLKSVIKILPLGTIAYYSGTDDRDKPDGDLVIFCDKGLMYGEKDLPYRQGGNSIDLPAIQWLLKQPGPRWYIGDAEFVGAASEFCIASRELLGNAKVRKMVTHYEGPDELLNELRGKGKIGEL